MIIDPYTWHQFTIEEKHHASSDTVAIRFKRPASYQFRAGQYTIVRTQVGNNQALIRQYSFASAPKDDILELLIQREPNGAVSSWFYDDAKAGDVVELSQPFGNFTLDTTDARPIVLIAGRVGIAPYLSMIREKSGRMLSLLYSVHTEDQICFPELIATCPSQVIVTSKTPRINKTVLEPILKDKPLVYICGSKQFVDAIRQYALENGTPESDIRRELFTLQ